MASPPQAPPRLPGYDLDAPTEAAAVAALARVFDDERAAEQWAAACREAGLAPGRVDSEEELTDAVAALSGQAGPTAVVARSIQIRMRTYQRLARLASRTAGGEGGDA